MITQNSRKTGVTLQQIKEICKVLKEDKEVLVAGLNSHDLYLRMINNEGVQAETEKTKSGFVFKLKK